MARHPIKRGSRTRVRVLTRPRVVPKARAKLPRALGTVKRRRQRKSRQ